jgi:Short C-terminal domain
MLKLTPEGETVIAGIAQRYGLSVDAVKVMLDAVGMGGGSMAQFSHPEFGGSGQWMRGGMTMVGDMFNHSLKATVDNLCSELSSLLANQPQITAPANPQFQSQSQGAHAETAGGDVSLFVPQQSFQSGAWWPSDLGNPSATGAQNSVRYAYFPEKRRLAIDAGGSVAVFDTLDHNIQGFGQQQSGDASITFTSQYGLVRVNNLPRIAGEAAPDSPIDISPSQSDQRHREEPSLPPAAPPTVIRTSLDEPDAIFALLERLADLKQKGVLTDEEFADKKADLLKRL